MSTPKPKVFWPLTIVAGVNDYIDFTVNGGTEMSARIAAGVYLSIASLLAACETAIQGPASGAPTTLVGVGGAAAASSADKGEAWSAETIPAGDYYAVVWNGAIFVAVGHDCAATSPDGEAWTSRTIPTGDYEGVAWNGTVFAAVGNGVVATSPDGITWTSRTNPGGAYLAVAWNGSLFAAVGTGYAMTSPDGTVWTGRTIPVADFEAYRAIVWGGSQFVAVGDSASHNCAATSPDGITWTKRTIPSGVYNGVAWSGSEFAAVGDSGAAATSTDGIAWTSRTIGAGNWHSIAWVVDRFVAAGWTVGATSPDGITWTPRTIPAATDITALAYPSLTAVVEATASSSGRVTIASSPFPVSLRFSTGSHAATSARDVLGFGAVDTASGLTHAATNQHQNGWYAPDPVVTETPERPVITRVVTEALSGRSVGMEYGVARYRKTVAFGFLPAYKVWLAEEGATHLNESFERWFNDGWARFRWWPDASVEGTYADYLFAPKTAEEIPHNRLSPGNPLYSLALEFRKYIA